MLLPFAENTWERGWGWGGMGGGGGGGGSGEVSTDVGPDLQERQKLPVLWEVLSIPQGHWS